MSKRWHVGSAGYDSGYVNFYSDDTEAIALGRVDGVDLGEDAAMALVERICRLPDLEAENERLRLAVWGDADDAADASLDETVERIKMDGRFSLASRHPKGKPGVENSFLTELRTDMDLNWHNTEDELPNVGWPVIGTDSTGRKLPMLYGEDGKGGWCWQVELPGDDFKDAEFVPVRWRYQAIIKPLEPTD